MDGTSPITVLYPSNQVTINRVHISHYVEFVRGFLLPSVRNQLGLTKETGSVEESSILRDLEGMYVQWVEGEVLRFGYVSLYHLWERQIVSLLEDQPAQRGRTFERGPGALPRRIRDVLLSEFSASVDDRVLECVDRGRRLVNEIKHGPKAPQPDGEGSWVAVTELDFDELAASLERFWDELPHSVDYSEANRPPRTCT